MTGMFEPQISRKPNLYPWTQDFIDAMWAGFWTPNEFDFKSDYSQFKTILNDSERSMVVNTLSAIGQIEIAVKTFWAKLGENLPHPSMSDLGFVLANTEVIHNQAYEKLLDVLGLGGVFEENLKNPIVKGRVDYLRKYNNKVYKEDSRKQYIYSIILFTIFVENVSLFSQFYNILYLNRFRGNILKDTAQQIAYTRNEEAIHALVGVRIINTLKEEYPELFDEDLQARIQEECDVALSAESKVVDWMLGDFNEDGLNPTLLKEFIKDRINQSFELIGFAKPYAIDEALIEKTQWFNEELLGNNHVDFFSKKSVDYAKSNKVYSEEDLF